MVDTGNIELKEDDKIFNKFKLGRFLNETPIYSKDKRGMNIPIRNRPPNAGVIALKVRGIAPTIPHLSGRKFKL